MRPGISRVLTLVGLALLIWCSLTYLRITREIPILHSTSANIDRTLERNTTFVIPQQNQRPLVYDDTQVHPIQFLIGEAHKSWKTTLDGQSQTLAAAVKEYRRRHHVPPPPHFDKWYQFAKKRDVKMIDEYDNIHHSLLPFWGISPSTIRAKTREALGYENKLVAVKIRGGKVVLTQDGPEWMKTALKGMLESFVEFLPDMDLAFNVHDEPRVVVPHDSLSRLLNIAHTQGLPVDSSMTPFRNSFSAAPDDLKNDGRFDEVKTTRFNKFSRQQAWIPSTLSCPTDSPARALEEGEAHDLTTGWALSDLDLVQNHTALTDVCNSPSLQHSHGFFDRPNTFNVVHDLFPIFSQSKMSTFQDILYPSPWYWSEKVRYDETTDSQWDNKTSSLWWRGSTTGGYSREGGWRRQHRQRLVQKLNALDDAIVLERLDTALHSILSTREWKRKEVPRRKYKHLINVHFSDVGQCDPGDCDAQREYFNVSAYADQKDAWKYRFLLDMDGNAFSGRYYAFLHSRSVTLKMAVFREWHDTWLKPWVHYIPLGLGGNEALEAVRYLSHEREGQDCAKEMAESSRQWAQQALRREDMEAWFFRLLLEYGRVIDDQRSLLGFVS